MQMGPAANGIVGTRITADRHRKLLSYYGMRPTSSSHSGPISPALAGGREETVKQRNSERENQVRYRQGEVDY